MNGTDVIKYKAMLTTRRDEMQRKTSQWEDLWIVPSHEQIETVQLAGEREFAARTLEREGKSLAQIRSALQRIEDGDFGVCLECEEPISPKRLAAVPWASYCLHCQERHDAQEAGARFEPSLAA